MAKGTWKKKRSLQEYKMFTMTFAILIEDKNVELLVNLMSIH